LKRERRTDEGTKNMTTESNPGATLKAYQDKIKNQVREAKTKLEELEAKAREQQAQAETATINRLKTTKESIDRKVQNLTTTNEAQLAQAKADVEAEAAKFKSSVDELATKFKMHVTK
jgi:predicted neutral ceramidase superfamily lipid hydrolase